MGNAVNFAKDNPYLIAGIAMAAYTGGASMAAATPATATAAAVPAVGFSWGSAASSAMLGVSVQAQAHGAEQAKIDADVANKEEEFAARDREIERKKRLLASVARQNVFSAAGGVAAFEGSSANIMDVSRRETAGGQLRDTAMTQGRKESRTRIAKGKGDATKINIGSSLIGAYQREARR